MKAIRDPRVQATVQFIIAELEHLSEREAVVEIDRLTARDPSIATLVRGRIDSPMYWHDETRVEPNWRLDYRLEAAHRILDSIISNRPIDSPRLTEKASLDRDIDGVLRTLLHQLEIGTDEQSVNQLLSTNRLDPSAYRHALARAALDPTDRVGALAEKILRELSDP